MAQINFNQNWNYGIAGSAFQVSNGTLTFFAFNVLDSVSWNNVNLVGSMGASAQLTYSLGLYSMNGGTQLSLVNSGEGSFSLSAGHRVYLSLSSTSATSNLTPGTWYAGIVGLTGSVAQFSLFGAGFNPGNAYTGAFLNGRMTASTNALPATYATSDLDITGIDAMSFPYLLITA